MRDTIKRKKIASAIISSTIGCIAMGGQFSLAQDATYTLEEIVVTARKREESMQDTPISISAFTAQSLEQRQIDSANQLSQITPNLIFDTNAPVSASNSAGQIYIRGVGQSDFQALNDPGVGVYIDGVYHARTVGSVVELLDLERVEVLRGPQGTLFGRNTIGGALNITTKKPSLEENSGSIKATIGDSSRFDTMLHGNIVLSEKAALRGMIASRKRDGYVTRLIDGKDLGNDNTQHARARLYWELNDDVSIDVSADYNKEYENGGALVFNRINTTSAFPRGASAAAGCPGAVFPAPPLPVPNVNDTRCANDFIAARNGQYQTEQDFDTFSKMENWGVSATIDWALDSVNIKSITSHRNLTFSSARDADGTGLRILHTASKTDDQQFSQEFQFSGSSFKDQLNWLAGAYYFDQEAEDESFIQLPEFVGEFILAGPAEIQSTAFFAQGTYSITERLDLTVGLRYTNEEKTFFPRSVVANQNAVFVLPDSIITPEYVTLLNSLVPSGTSPIIANIPPPTTIVTLPVGTNLVPTTPVESNASKTTPMVNVSYDFSNDFMGYVTYSEGFKGGGVNFRETIPSFASIPFEPEVVEQYEIGFKSDWLNSRLRLNGAAFFTDYANVQVVVTPQLVPTVINAAAGEIKGFELELTAVPTDSILITTGLGYLNTEYTELSDSAINFGGLSFDSVFQNAPELTANMGISYAFDIGNLSVSPRLDWIYRDERYFNAVNTPTLLQDSYNLINAGIEVSSGNDWSLTLGVTNATDKTYRVAGFSTFGASSGYEETAFSRGREWSLGARYNF